MEFFKKATQISKAPAYTNILSPKSIFKVASIFGQRGGGHLTWNVTYIYIYIYIYIFEIYTCVLGSGTIVFSSNCVWNLTVKITG